MMKRATFVLANCRQLGTILLAIVLATIARSGVSQLAATPIETSIGQRVFFTGHRHGLGHVQALTAYCNFAAIHAHRFFSSWLGNANGLSTLVDTRLLCEQ